MYLQIGGSRYSVRRRIVYEDAVAYLSVTPEPVEVAGMIQLCRDDGFVLAEDDAGAYARHTYAGTRLTLTNAAEVSPQPKPTPEPQATRAETLAAVSFARMMLPSVQSSMGADDTITVAALYNEWTEGSYKVGDIRLAWYNGSHQPWKCRQEHDTTTYPDITPDGSAWRTFWIPFHGTTPETAQDWIAPSGAHDAYSAGDIVNYNGMLYQSTINGNVWSPDVYPAGWTVYEAATEPSPEPEPDPKPEEPSTYPEWVQPTGVHDAYNTGDIVNYNGTLYKSVIDGNVWAPDAYPQGWEVYNA